MSTIIPIFFTFDSNYVTAAAVTFRSMLENADQTYQYRLYVLHAGIPERLRKRLTERYASRMIRLSTCSRRTLSYKTGTG